MDKEQKEIILLLALDVLGVGWLAKDENGVLSAYVNEPRREENLDPFLPGEYFWENWGGDQIDFFFKDGILKEVKETDEVPTKVKELLLEKAAELSDSMILKEFIERATK